MEHDKSETKGGVGFEKDVQKFTGNAEGTISLKEFAARLSTAHRAVLPDSIPFCPGALGALRVWATLIALGEVPKALSVPSFALRGIRLSHLGLHEQKHIGLLVSKYH